MCENCRELIERMFKDIVFQFLESHRNYLDNDFEMDDPISDVVCDEDVFFALLNHLGDVKGKELFHLSPSGKELSEFYQIKTFNDVFQIFLSE